MKIVQVPMEEVEAQALMSQAKRMHMSRSDLIRRACAEYPKGLTAPLPIG